MSSFVKAERSQKRLRFGAAGLPGGGKSYSMQRMAQVVAQRMGKGRVAVIDAENGSASLYAGMTEDGITWAFDTLILKDYSPATYTTHIKEAGAAGYDCLIIDGLTQAWEGEGGALDMHADATKQTPGNNSYFAWREVSPVHAALVEAILNSPCHVFASLRVKMEYVVETINGKSVPKKVGLKPAQRQGMEYEFDIFAEFNDTDNPVMTITKSRCFQIKRGTQYLKPGADVAEPLIEWLSTGAALPAGVVEVTLFDQFYRRLLAAKTLAEVSAIGKEAKLAESQMSPAEFAQLQTKAAAVKSMLPAGSAAPVATFVSSEPPKPAEQPPANVNGGASAPRLQLYTVDIQNAKTLAELAALSPKLIADRDNGNLSADDFKKLAAAGKAKKLEIEAAAAKPAEQPAATPAPAAQGEGETLQFSMMKGKIEQADSVEAIAACGREASGLKPQLAAGEFEKLVEMGKARREILTAKAAGKSAPTA